MEEHSIDYKYALELVKRVNGFVESRPELREFLVYRGFNLWQSYQGVLFGDAKAWTQSNGSAATRRSPVRILKLWVSIFFCVIISLASALYLLLGKKRVLIFTEDRTEGRYKNDLRLAELYSVLHTGRVPYMEVVHTILGRKTFKRFVSRNREVIYLESIDYLVAPLVWRDKLKVRKILNALDFPGFKEQERRFVYAELEKFISSRSISIARLKVFSWFLRFSKIERMFAIDDIRHYNEFVLSGKLANIPTIAIQHGHFTKYHTGWLKMTGLGEEVIRPRVLLVWSEYWKQELLNLGTYFRPSEIIVGNRKSLSYAGASESNGKLSVLIPYEKDAPKAEVKGFIMDLLESGDVEIIFKIREDQDKADQIKEYGLLEYVDRITLARSLSEVAPRVSVVMGTYSTLLYDFVEQMKPVGILESSIDYGEGMVRNGLADLIPKGADRVRVTRDLAKLSPKELESRKSKLAGSERRSMASVLRDIIKENVSI